MGHYHSLYINSLGHFDSLQSNIVDLVKITHQTDPNPKPNLKLNPKPNPNPKPNAKTEHKNVKIWVHDGIPFFTLIYYCLT